MVMLPVTLTRWLSLSRRSEERVRVCVCGRRCACARLAWWGRPGKWLFGDLFSGGVFCLGEGGRKEEGKESETRPEIRLPPTLLCSLFAQSGGIARGGPVVVGKRGRKCVMPGKMEGVNDGRERDGLYKSTQGAPQRPAPALRPRHGLDKSMEKACVGGVWGLGGGATSIRWKIGWYAPVVLSVGVVVFSGGLSIRLAFPSPPHARATRPTRLPTALGHTEANAEKRGGQGWGGWAEG